MQDRYTGDIGDFGKYGLLKALSGDDLSLGMVWYLVPDEGRSGDGAHVGYLDPTPTNVRRFRDCDPTVYDVLGEIVQDGTRSVRSVRERAILPPGTVFYEEPLSFDGMPGIGPEAKGKRLEHRSRWAQGALDATRGCDVVFADPDNGLESGTPRHRKRGPKFAYFDELVPYLQRNQSLVVYHHLHRSYSTGEQMQERLAQINERLGEPFALLYKRGTLRAFFVVPSEAHRGILHDRAKRFVEGCWGQHFALIGMEEDRVPKSKGTTEPGYTNRNGQTVVRRTDLSGTDYKQYIYVLRCGDCGNEYGANGSDIWLRRCPNCQGGAPGLPTG